jgi:hypothetical protein
MPSEPLAATSEAYWGDEEPDDLVFEPVPPERLRPYFTSRHAFRTRGHRRPRRFLTVARRVRPTRRSPRTRRLGCRARARSPGPRLAEDDDPEPDAVTLYAAAAHVRAQAELHYDERTDFGLEPIAFPLARWLEAWADERAA